MHKISYHSIDQNAPKTLPNAGFTLLEIAIVVGIIALVVGMSMQAIQSVVASARIVATKEKMKIIDDALEAYWIVNKRLPCPADNTLAESNANFGVEAANHNAQCKSGTPAANKTANSADASWAVQGGIPFATLGITESYTYDGWGRRFSYATSGILTKDNAALSYESDESCHFVTIGYTPNKPAYTLISHGENGFGAATKAGSYILASGAKEKETWNTQRSTTPPYNFNAYYLGYYYIMRDASDGDDIVNHKSLWQLNNGQVADVMQNRSVLFFSSSTTPYAYHYAWDGDSFVKQSNFATTPGGALTGKIAAAVSDSNCQRLLIYPEGASGNDSVCYQDKVDGTYTTSSCPYLSGSQNYYGGDFYRVKVSSSFDGEAAIIYGSTPYIHFMNPANSTVSFPLVINQTSYSSSATGAAYQPDTAPTGQPQNLQYSKVSGHLAVAHATSPYVSIYNRATPTGFARVKLANPTTLPTGNATDVAYSGDGKYLAVSHATTPYVTIYSISGTNYTKIANPATLPTGNATSVSFSSDSQFMAVGHATTPFMTVYSIDSITDTFTKLDDPSTLPSGTVNDLDFAAGDNILATAITATAGNKPLLLYHIQHGEIITPMADPDTVPATGTTGHSVEFADSGRAIPRPGAITSGLVGWWRLNEGTGTAAADSSVSGNAGTLTNGPVWSSELTGALKTNGALDFDGVDDYINVPSASAWNYGTGDFTWTAWIYPNRVNGSYEMILSFNNGASNIQPYFALRDTYLHFYNGTIFEVNTMSADVWQHVAITRTGGVVEMYKNGSKLAGNSTQSTSIGQGAGKIGEWMDATPHNFDGKIDDVRIYNRALTVSEVQKIYNGGG